MSHDVIDRGLSAVCESPTRRRGFHVLMSASMLFVGALIYVVYRPTTLLVFRWIEWVGLEEVVAAIRASAVGQWNAPDWFLYSLPDMLWVTSFGHAVYAVLAGANVGLRHYVGWALLIGGGALLSEVGQWIGVVPGTFD